MNRPTILAMVLAGGRVDELGVLTHYRPKSAVPFGGFARVIDFALSNLMHSGIDRVAILSQYRSYSLINHIGTGASWDMVGRNRGISILPPFKDYSNPHWYRGSADAVFQNLDFIRHYNPSVVLILSGDHIYQMDYSKMIRYHHDQDADLTAALVEVPMESASRFGVAEIADEGRCGGRVLAYEEKPENPKYNKASLTLFCFKPSVLVDVLRQNQQAESYEFGRDIIPMMMAQDYNVYGYTFRGYWGYTKTIDEYWQTSMDLLGKEPKIDMEAWGIRTNLHHRDIANRQPVKIGSQGKLSNSLVYDGCVIDGTVRNSILFPGVHVRSGAEINNSIIFFDNIVHEGVRLNRVVSDADTVYNRGALVGAADENDTSGHVTVIGSNNSVPAGIQIGSGCVVAPSLPAASWPENNLQDGEALQ